MADERCTLLLLMVFVVKQLSAEELTCDPKTVSLKDFNIDKFLGTWYEVYHYPANPQEHYYCCIDDYEKTLAGDVTIASSLYDKTERRRENSTGVVKVSDNVLDITYPNRNEWSSAYYVAATDYDQYSIVVGCPEITGTEPNVYVMFRSKNPNELARKAAEDSLKTYNLDIKDFYKEC